jgi:type I restriction enzyme, S subunit
MYGATVAEISILCEPATCNQAICAILPNDKYPHSFVYEFLKNKRNEIKSMAVGAAQQNISQVVIQEIEYPCERHSFLRFKGRHIRKDG